MPSPPRMKCRRDKPVFDADCCDKLTLPGSDRAYAELPRPTEGDSVNEREFFPILHPAFARD